MPWKHVYAPTKGEVSNVPATLLPPEASPYAKGVYMKNGEVCSDFGYVDFPSPSATGTNELLGKVMRIDQFYLLEGYSHLLCFTTTTAYEYNSGATWEDVTQGVDVDDCEDAWTDRSGGDVTCSADTTYFVQGAESAKMIVAGSAGQELLATFDTEAKDTSSHRYLHFWVYLTAVTTADQIRFRISEDIAGGTSNTYCDWDIGALAKDKWIHKTIDLDGTPEDSNSYTDSGDLDSIDSVGLYLQDTAWEGTIYIDDVRIVTQFTRG